MLVSDMDVRVASYSPRGAGRAVCPTDSANCPQAALPASSGPAWEAIRRRAVRLARHIYQHPDVAEAICGGQPKWLVGDNGVHGEPQWLALLRERELPTSRLLSFALRPLRCWQLLGDDLLGTGECAANAFVEQVAERMEAGDVECVLMEALAAESSLWRSIEGAIKSPSVRVFHDAVQPHWTIALPEDAASYWEQFSSKARYNLRRSVKRLAHHVTCYRAEHEVAAFLERAEFVSRKSWQGRRFGPRLRCCAEQAGWLKSLARCGAWRSYTLEQDDKPLAFALGWQWRGRFMYEECGHLPEVAADSVGTVLLYRILEDLLKHDQPRLVDFGFGDSEQKRLFGNREGASRRVLLMSTRWKPAAAHAIGRWENRFLQCGRRGVDRLGLRRCLRRQYRLRG